MPIVTKDKMLQIRLEQELFDRAGVIADFYGMTVSAFVRNLINRGVDQMEKKAVSDAKWDATLAARAAAAASAEGAVIAPEGPLARKRRLEKGVKDTRAKKKANRYD
jgi:hypothetical protein